MKKFLLAMFALLAGAALTACAAFSTNSDSTTDLSGDFSNPLEVVTFQAVSATELLIGSQTAPVNTAQPLGFTLLEEETEEEPVESEEIDVLDRYLTMMEQFLGEDDGLNVTAVESDLPEYAVKVVFVTRTLTGEDITYVLYYNETVLPEELPEENDETVTTAPESDDETDEPETEETDPVGYHGPRNDDAPRHEPDFAFDDEDEEVVSLLEGILIIGDLTYQLEGKQIVEDGEQIMMMHSYLDQENFVRVRYQTDTEDGERKFFYEARVDGAIVSRSKVKVQIEDGERKVHLAFLDETGRGQYEFKEETVDGITYIKIRYAIETAQGGEERGMIHIRAVYDETTGLTTYEYFLRPENGGHEHQIEREHRDHRGEGSCDGNGPDFPEADGEDVTTATGDDILVG